MPGKVKNPPKNPPKNTTKVAAAAVAAVPAPVPAVVPKTPKTPKVPKARKVKVVLPHLPKKCDLTTHEINPVTGRCVVKCGPGSQRDPITGRCKRDTTKKKEGPGGCPKGKEISSVSGKCVAVCKSGTQRDPHTGRCKKVVTEEEKRLREEEKRLREEEAAKIEAMAKAAEVASRAKHHQELAHVLAAAVKAAVPPAAAAAAGGNIPRNYIMGNDVTALQQQQLLQQQQQQLQQQLQQQFQRKQQEQDQREYQLKLAQQQKEQKDAAEYRAALQKQEESFRRKLAEVDRKNVSGQRKLREEYERQRQLFMAERAERNAAAAAMEAGVPVSILPSSRSTTKKTVKIMSEPQAIPLANARYPTPPKALPRPSQPNTKQRRARAKNQLVVKAEMEKVADALASLNDKDFLRAIGRHAPGTVLELCKESEKLKKRCDANMDAVCRASLQWGTNASDAPKPKKGQDACAMMKAWLEKTRNQSIHQRFSENAKKTKSRTNAKNQPKLNAEDILWTAGEEFHPGAFSPEIPSSSAKEEGGGKKSPKGSPNGGGGGGNGGGGPPPAPPPGPTPPPPPAPPSGPPPPSGPTPMDITTEEPPTPAPAVPTVAATTIPIPPAFILNNSKQTNNNSKSNPKLRRQNQQKIIREQHQVNQYRKEALNAVREVKDTIIKTATKKDSSSSSPKLEKLLTEVANLTEAFKQTQTKHDTDIQNLTQQFTTLTEKHTQAEAATQTARASIQKKQENLAAQMAELVVKIDEDQKATAATLAKFTQLYEQGKIDATSLNNLKSTIDANHIRTQEQLSAIQAAINRLPSTSARRNSDTRKLSEAADILQENLNENKAKTDLVVERLFPPDAENKRKGSPILLPAPPGPAPGGPTSPPLIPSHVTKPVFHRPVPRYPVKGTAPGEPPRYVPEQQAVKTTIYLLSLLQQFHNGNLEVGDALKHAFQDATPQMLGEIIEHPNLGEAFKDYFMTHPQNITPQIQDALTLMKWRHLIDTSNKLPEKVHEDSQTFVKILQTMETNHQLSDLNRLCSLDPVVNDACQKVKQHMAAEEQARIAKEEQAKKKRKSSSPTITDDMTTTTPRGMSPKLPPPRKGSSNITTPSSPSSPKGTPKASSSTLSPKAMSIVASQRQSLHDLNAQVDQQLPMLLLSQGQGLTPEQLQQVQVTLDQIDQNKMEAEQSVADMAVDADNKLPPPSQNQQEKRDIAMKAHNEFNDWFSDAFDEDMTDADQPPTPTTKTTQPLTAEERELIRTQYKTQVIPDVIRGMDIRHPDRIRSTFLNINRGKHLDVDHHWNEFRRLNPLIEYLADLELKYPDRPVEVNIIDAFELAITYAPDVFVSAIKLLPLGTRIWLCDQPQIKEECQKVFPPAPPSPQTSASSSATTNVTRPRGKTVTASSPRIYVAPIMTTTATTTTAKPPSPPALETIPEYEAYTHDYHGIPIVRGFTARKMIMDDPELPSEEEKWEVMLTMNLIKRNADPDIPNFKEDVVCAQMKKLPSDLQSKVLRNPVLLEACGGTVSTDEEKAHLLLETEKRSPLAFILTMGLIDADEEARLISRSPALGALLNEPMNRDYINEQRRANLDLSSPLPLQTSTTTTHTLRSAPALDIAPVVGPVAIRPEVGILSHAPGTHATILGQTTIPTAHHHKSKAEIEADKKSIIENRIIEQLLTDKSTAKSKFATNWEALEHIYKSKGRVPPVPSQRLDKWLNDQLLKYKGDIEQYRKDLEAKEQLSDELHNKRGKI